MDALIFGRSDRTRVDWCTVVKHLPSKAVVTRFGGIFVIYQQKLVWSTIPEVKYKAFVLLDF
jgi:hypothetical protein